MAKKKKTETALTESEAYALLSEHVRHGDVPLVRAFFDCVFWQGRQERANWEMLETATQNQNLAMMRLLVKWGARHSATDLEALKQKDPDHYPTYVRLMRRAGLRLNAETVVDAKRVEEDVAARLRAAYEEAARRPKDLFVEAHQLDKIPKPWLQVLGVMQKQGAAETVIAGGALRDLYNDRPVKDVDIFLKSRGREGKNKKFILKAFQQAGIHLQEQSIEVRDGYSMRIKRMPLPAPKDTKLYHHEDAETSMQSWNAMADDGTVYNIVFVAAKDSNGLTETPQKLLEVFDFNLCQIATDGQALHFTPAYEEGVREKKITLNAANITSADHLSRIAKKYDGWQLCPESEKVLQGQGRRPPPKRVRFSSFGS